jgi:stress response protein YsnF
VVDSRTEINIPLKRELIQVTKEPYVKEELLIKKKPVTEHRTITEEIRSEKVTVKDPEGKDLEEVE